MLINSIWHFSSSNFSRVFISRIIFDYWLFIVDKCETRQTIAFLLQVVVQSIQDPTQFVLADYRYISAPSVLETRFNSAGTGLSITFDQPTDQGGAVAAQFDCGTVVQVLMFAYRFF
jgi:hypothetical protein